MNRSALLLTTVLSFQAVANENSAATSFSLFDFQPDVPYDETTTWIAAFFPDPSISIEIIDKRASSETYIAKEGICRDSRVALTGGFFKNDESGLKPIGLHMHLGEEMASIAPWISGGYIYQTRSGEVYFSTVRNGLPSGAVEALQAKPFLIEDGAVAISERNEGPWDRIAIGRAKFKDKTGLLVVAAISDLSRRRSVRLHHFAEAVLALSETFALKLYEVLNLDGAQGAFVWFPKASMYYGAKVERYVPSIICIK